MRLYFIYATGCGACEIAKPELDKFEQKHRGVDVKRIDLLEAKWVHPWQPEATPTYVVEEPGYARVQHAGALKADQIEQLIQRAHEMMGIA
jgi:thiol-disulfide isomerase/thioredoxin